MVEKWEDSLAAVSGELSMLKAGDSSLIFLEFGPYLVGDAGGGSGLVVVWVFDLFVILFGLSLHSFS
jgi:hypothetical protein